jgi:holo-[acyl-carrier protein] synthase
MILGIGIDIIESSRVGEKINRKSFREKVFSRHEIDYCEAQQRKAQHYAARFAAKEAFLKALGVGLTAGFDLHEIEITHLQNGEPKLSVKGNFLKLKKKFKWNKIHISISHIESIACAIVILEK